MTRAMTSGGACFYRDKMRAAIAYAEKRLEDKPNDPYQRGKLDAYQYALSELDSLLDWLGMDKNALPDAGGSVEVRKEPQP